jgi:hypothetical protein
MKIQSLMMISAAFAISLVFIGVAEQAHADSWVIDTDKIIVLVTVDSQGKVQFEEAFIDGNHAISRENLKVDRPSETGGRIFGTTDAGYNIYMIYDLENNTVKAKIWTELGTERIILKGDSFRVF